VETRAAPRARQCLIPRSRANGMTG